MARSWLSIALLVAGCNYNPSPVQPQGDGAPTDDAPTVDGLVSEVDGPTNLTLVDRGLVLRYFMDEAANGQGPAALLDSAPEPLSLPLTYQQAMFVEDGGNRGIRWPMASSTGKAERAFSGTKLATQLTPATTVTIEIVAKVISAGSAAGSESQLTGLRGSNPDFVLAAVGSTDLRFFRPFGNLGATWLGVHDQQRMVLHLVFDSTRSDPETRIELFKNGMPVAKTTSSPPGLNQNVGLGGGDDLVIGNRQNEDRSIEGTIFYVAYYKVALDGVEISNNAQRLIVNDDP